MKKKIILAIFCIGIVLSVSNLLPAFIHRNTNMSTNKDLVSNPKTSTIIIEDSSEFSEGTLENLTIWNNGYLALENEIPSQPIWNNMTLSTHPSRRHSHSMVYAPKYNKIIMFGGNDGDSFINETWSYNLDTNKWTNITYSIQPSARTSSMVYNSKHDVIIMFGGMYEDEGPKPTDETWAFSIESNEWREMMPTTNPDARYEHSMVYDSTHDKVILFGGFVGPST
ncbi:MAG: Kelch repeat-containing protein, partial [Candidatus Hodarchaeales archaeon]